MLKLVVQDLSIIEHASSVFSREAKLWTRSDLEFWCVLGYYDRACSKNLWDFWPPLMKWEFGFSDEELIAEAIKYAMESDSREVNEFGHTINLMQQTTQKELYRI